MSDERIRVVGIGGTLRQGSVSSGALRRALGAAEDAGAEVKLLDLRELDLPMYEPGRRLEKLGRVVVELAERLSPERPEHAARRRRARSAPIGIAI